MIGCDVMICDKCKKEIKEGKQCPYCTPTNIWSSDYKSESEDGKIRKIEYKHKEEIIENRIPNKPLVQFAPSTLPTAEKYKTKLRKSGYKDVLVFLFLIVVVIIIVYFVVIKLM